MKVFTNTPASQTDWATSTTADDTIADFGHIKMLANTWVGTVVSVVLYASVAAGATPSCGQQDN